MTSNGKVFLILFLSSLSSFTVANWWESGISKDINLANFDEYIGGDKHIVVEVFAQWCHFCMMAQPEWDKLAEHYMGDNQNRKDVIVAKINAGVEPALADRFGVNAYPAFLLIKKNEVYPASRYNNERTADRWINWIESLVGSEEVAVPKEELDGFPTIDQILDDLDQDPIIGDVQDERIEKVERNGNGSGDDSMDIIVQKLDFLVDLVHGQDGSVTLDQRARDMKELKSLISDIDKKVTNKSPGSNDDINFAHGISFLLLGVFLGIGVSFGMINYQKLARSRKLLD